MPDGGRGGARLQQEKQHGQVCVCSFLPLEVTSTPAICSLD